MDYEVLRALCIVLSIYSIASTFNLIVALIQRDNARDDLMELCKGIEEVADGRAKLFKAFGKIHIESN